MTINPKAVSLLKTAARNVTNESNKQFIKKVIKAIEVFAELPIVMYIDQESYLIRSIRDISEFEYKPGTTDLNGKLLDLALNGIK